MIKSNLNYYATRAGFESHAQLARKLRVNRVTVWRWCDGNRSPSLEMALKISRLLNQPVEKIFQLVS